MAAVGEADGEAQHLRCYLTMVEKHIRGELGKVQAADLTNQMIMDFIHSRQKQGLSAGTVRLLLFLLKSIVQAGEEMGACLEKHCI